MLEPFSRSFLTKTEIRLDAFILPRSSTGRVDEKKSMTQNRFVELVMTPKKKEVTLKPNCTQGTMKKIEFKVSDGIALKAHHVLFSGKEASGKDSHLLGRIHFKRKNVSF